MHSLDWSIIGGALETIVDQPLRPRINRDELDGIDRRAFLGAFFSSIELRMKEPTLTRGVYSGTTLIRQVSESGLPHSHSASVSEVTDIYKFAAAGGDHGVYLFQRIVWRHRQYRTVQECNIDP